MLNEMKHLCSCIVDYTWRLGIVQRFFAIAQVCREYDVIATMTK